MLVILWIYTAIWGAVLTYICFRRHLSPWLRLPLMALLILGTPALEDLFMTYERYLTWWNSCEGADPDHEKA
jgi:hypothetical protein